MHRVGRFILSAFFIISALAFAWTTLCAEINFAWRQPMFDQWRLYHTFLSLPFPENVLQLENGHRPIFPNLLRVAEIHWLAADQLLQITCGAIFAFLTAFLLAFCALREKSISPIARCAGAMLAIIGVLWLANARMLLHGNESVHAYLLTLCVVGACLLTHRAARAQSIVPFLAATATCVVAMFCFGPGAASFGSIVLLALIFRLPLRWLLAPFVVLGVCLIVYVIVLPGGQGVRHMLDIRPIENLLVMARWLSSPWVNGWLGLAEPHAQWMSIRDSDHTTTLLRTGANLLTTVSGLSWRALGTILGFLGAATFCARTVCSLRRGAHALSAWQAVAIGTGFFALCSAIIFAVGRLDYLKAVPDQVYANRYLIWPSLFWCALAMQLLHDLAHSNWRFAQIAGTCFLVALPCALWPSHIQGVEWASSVYRHSQQAAASVRSHVFDGKRFPNGADAPRETVLQTLEQLRREHLSMFADPTWQQVGKPCPWPIVTNNSYAVRVESVTQGTDAIDGQPFASVSGVITSGIAQLQKTGQLAILDSNDVIVGLAEFSFFGKGREALRFDVPRKRGFDAYIRHFNPARTYFLVLLAPQAQQATRLAEIAPSR
jgi:hypothetical protein